MVTRAMRGLMCLALMAAGCTSVAGAQAGGPDSPPVPQGRAIGALDRASCHRLLRRGGVRFEAYGGEHASAVEAPIVLEGPIGGVQVEHARKSAVHSVLDCRLALALLAWAPVLREAGVRRIEHYSALRPGARVRGGGSPSGHASGLAVDAGRFELDDGRELDVLEDWTDRTRGAPPCPDGATGEDAELLRRVVCTAVERDLFQVVITPHHNRAHRNHVHLEVVPDVDWSFVR